jgi:hypothetical protein
MHLITQMSQEQERPSLLEEKINQSYISNENIENEQLEITARLNKIEGLKGLLPKRGYGQKWTDVKFGISAQSVIERGDAPLASYLGLSTGHWRRIEEAETARQEVIKRMQEKTEELQYKNQQRAQQRQKDILWNQTHNVSQHRIIR